MNKIFCLVALFFSFQSFAQNEDIRLGLELGKPPKYYVDYLEVDSAKFQLFKLSKEDIAGFKTKKGKEYTGHQLKTILGVWIRTDFLIVLDDRKLVTRKQKKAYLSSVKTEQIISISRMENEKAFKEYGNQGLKGVIIIRTTN